MNFIEIIKENRSKIIKIILVVFGIIVVLSVIGSIGGLRTVPSYNSGSYGVGTPQPADFEGTITEKAYDNYSYGINYESEDIGLSIRNIAPIPSSGGYVSGDTSEQFEVKQYSARIETGNLSDACKVISSLKPKDYVVFTSASEYDDGCSYNFKVKKDNTEEVLNIIKALNPKDLSENTTTIQKRIEDFTSQEDILKKQLESINQTLEEAVKSYDVIAGVATNTRDAESLAKIIDSKIKLIERLTAQKISISNQLDALARSKGSEMDKLDYTQFSVYIFEIKFVDWESTKDSWISAVKAFVLSINQNLQDITLGLIALVFAIIKFGIYVLIIVVVGKFGWGLIKKIWNK